MRLKYPGVDDRFFLEGVENLRQFHQGVENDLLILRPLSDVRSSVDPVSIVELRGELAWEVERLRALMTMGHWVGNSSLRSCCWRQWRHLGGR